jgi:hypothetical protein
MDCFSVLLVSYMEIIPGSSVHVLLLRHEVAIHLPVVWLLVGVYFLLFVNRRPVHTDKAVPDLSGHDILIGMMVLLLLGDNMCRFLSEVVLLLL